MNRMIRWFENPNLPPHLQSIMNQCRNLAVDMDAALPDGAEKQAGLRHLLEAKDCFIRARVEQHEAKAAELAGKIGG